MATKPLSDLLLVAAVSVFWLAAVPSWGRTLVQEGEEAARREEREDYFQKWLREDIVYIITEEERDVFQRLTTPEEKEKFIQQFWYRRDPDMRTSANEVKEEHYRRLAFVNERFGSGRPGWQTDRGRIYVIHGAPDEVESHPSGGMYRRPMHEGGGSTNTFPYEVWRYLHIPGLGQDLELEFVDVTLTGEYRLSLYPEEKDALLRVPGAGLTVAEELGLVTKAQRPFFSPGNRESYPLMTRRAKDNPFARYETYARIQAPREIKYRDLKELVDIKVRFETLPVRFQQDCFKLNDEQVLVPVTLELDNRELSFAQENGSHVARIAVYGVVTSITKRIVEEFDDELFQSYRPEVLPRKLESSSNYQKILTLNGKMRYRLDLVVKDLHSGRMGWVRQAIVPARYGGEDLRASSLILSDKISPLQEIPRHEMFVLGDVKIRPRLDRDFLAPGPLGVYLQVYNVGVDQSTQEPLIRASYRITRGAETLLERVDEAGESIQLFSPQRLVLIKGLPLQDLKPGRFRLSVQVRDRIKGQEVEAEEEFQVKALPQWASRP